MKKKELTTEAQALKDIYWNYMDKGGNVSEMWQEMFDAAVNMRYSKLRGMEKAYNELSVKDKEALNTIREMLQASGGEVTKDITWWYKERDKILKNKAKLSMKISKEKKDLVR